MRPSSAAVIRPNVGGPDRAARLAEARLVEEVEGLDAELQRWLSPRSKFLKRDRSVRAKPGPADGVAAGVAELVPRSRPAVRRWKQDVSNHCSMVCGASSFGSQVWSGRLGRRREVHVAGVVDGEREPGLLLDDAVELPAAEDVLHEARPGPRASAAPQPKLSDEAVADVEERVALLAGQRARRWLASSPCVDRQDRAQLVAVRCSGPRRGRWRGPRCRRRGSSRRASAACRTLAWSESYQDSRLGEGRPHQANAGIEARAAARGVGGQDRRVGLTSMKIGRW